MNSKKRKIYIVISFIFLQIPLTTQAKFEISSQPSEQVKEFTTLHNIDKSAYSANSINNYWKFGKWKLSDILYLEASYGCSINTIYIFWPALNKCSGALEIYVDELELIKKQREEIENLLAQQEKSKSITNTYIHTIQLNSMREDHLDELSRLKKIDWRIPNYLSTDQEFENIRSDKYILSIDGENYKLEDFPNISRNGIDLTLNGTNNTIKKERLEIITGVVASFAAFIVGIFLFIKLFRYTRNRLYQAKEAASNQLNKLQAANQRRKVRSVMMDETIREMTRTALNNTDDRSKEVLIVELRKAIESGNHELANALELALKKT